MYVIADRLVGRTLRKLRREAGLSQTGLAEKLGVGQSLVSKIESGERSLHLNEVYAYAEALDMTPQRIVDEVARSVNPPHGR